MTPHTGAAPSPEDIAAWIHRQMVGPHGPNCRSCVPWITRRIQDALRAERDNTRHEAVMAFDEERHRLLTALEAAHPPHAPVPNPCIACEALYR